MTLLNKIDTYMSAHSKVIVYLTFCLSVLAAYWLLVSPGASVTNIYLNDVFALTDAAYRVAAGQMPGRDFYTAIGPINFYLSAIGLQFGYQPGVTLALANVAAYFLIVAPILNSLLKRFSVYVVLIILVYTCLLFVAPLGDVNSYASQTWGVFYNRHAWAGLMLTFLFYVAPRENEGKQVWLDVIALSLLVLFLLYCKITYGVIAVAFIIANAIVSKYNRKLSLLTFATVIVFITILEVVTSINGDYLHSIQLAIQARGVNRGGLWGIVDTTLSNFPIISALVMAALWLSYQKLLSLFDWLLIIGACVTGVILVDQNGGTQGIPTLFAIFICLAELARRKLVGLNRDGSSPIALNISIMPLLLMLPFMAPHVANRVLAIQGNYEIATHYKPSKSVPKNLQSFIVQRSDVKSLLSLSQEEGMSIATLQKIRLQVIDKLSTTEYYDSILDGYILLEKYVVADSNILVLDIASPYGFLFNLKPREKGYPFKWTWPAQSSEVVFNDIDLAIEPKFPYHQKGAFNYKEAYQSFLHANYVLIDSSDYWDLWQKK
jgi:hypothetical protein